MTFFQRLTANVRRCCNPLSCDWPMMDPTAEMMRLISNWNRDRMGLLCFMIDIRAHFINIDLLKPSMDKYMSIKEWHEISYPFPNFNAAAVEVWA